MPFSAPSSRGLSIDARPSHASLLAQVLGLLSVGFLFTALGSYSASSLSFGVSLGVMLGNFLVLFGIFAARGNPQAQTSLFFLFTLLEGVGLGPTIAHYAHVAGTHVVLEAALTTGLGMAAIGVFSYAVSIDYRKVSAVGTVLLLALLIFGIATAFLHLVKPHVYDWITLGVFTVLTVGDFARLRAGGDGATAVELALDIFLDSINIFLALLDLLTKNDQD